MQVETFHSKPLDMEIQLPPLTEPDYSGLPSLHINEQPAQLDYSTMFVIGIGAFGGAILRSLAGRIPVDKTGIRPVQLLGISLKGEPAPDYPLPEIVENLRDEEWIELPVSRTSTAFDWYKLPTQAWSRPDGRLAVFQNLAAAPSLWDVLQKYLEVNENSLKKDVWIVGASFDSSSGMLWDLAHLIQRISEHQKQPLFVGCLLALPNDKWATTHMVDSAAMLREVECRLRNNTSRKYEYVIGSDNPDLRGMAFRSDDDITSLVLCEPNNELYGEGASMDLINKTSLALYMFSQRPFWNGAIDVRSFLMAGKRTINAREELCVSAFGISAHEVPVSMLKQFGRWVLVDCLLFNRTQGIFANWQAQIEYSEGEIRQFLGRCQHPLLTLIATINTSFDYPPVMPSSADVDAVLAHHLWLHFEDYLKDEEMGIARCRAFLISLSEFFEGTNLQIDAIDVIRKVILDVSNEIFAWSSAARKIRETIQLRINHVETNLKQVVQDEFEQWIFRHESLDELRKFLLSDHELMKSLREYAHIIWIRRGGNLKLVLDALQPGWREDGKEYRFYSDTEQENLLDAVFNVVFAFTQEERYWPSKLSDPKNILPDNATALGKARPTLVYDDGKLPSGLGKTTRSVQVSGDQGWRDRIWFPPVLSPERLDIFPSSFGVLATLHQSIPLSTVPLIRKMQEKYLLSSNSAKTSHIFLTEQTVADWERNAFNKLTIRQRRDLNKLFRISYATLDLIEGNLPWVIFFVNVWGNECIVNQEGQTVIVSLTAAVPLWKSGGSNDHPLEILSEFLREPVDEKEYIKKSLSSQFKELPMVTDRQLDHISGWWQEDQKDMDWFIMANGIAQKRR
jgi:hypothetical protein